MIRYGIVVHGGVGSTPALADGCARAAERGRAVLRKGGTALEAVIEATVELEDDGRYNAGSGSILRLDGRTIEMDASLMTSGGELGAVAAIQRVKNPIRVAREVMRTPHVLLSGEGAQAFARRCGFGDHYAPSAAREKHGRVVRAMAGAGGAEVREAWRRFDLKSRWNFPARYEEVFGHDTVGAVAVDAGGELATANSTGGASPMLAGRIGDSPLIGCGFYAGASAAVAATGIGEEIIRRMLCRQVHDWISAGEEVQGACERGVGLYPGEIPVGVIAVSRRGSGVAANREMASGFRIEG